MPNVEYRKLAYVNCPETIASLNEEALDPSQDIEALRNYLLPVVRQSFVTDEDIDWNQLTLILAQYYKQRAQITIQIYEISNQLQRTESRVLKEIGEIQTIIKADEESKKRADAQKELYYRTFVQRKVRRGKTDKKDAVKLANYGLDHWLTLPRYVPDEDTRLMLKTCYRQYQQYSKVQTMLKNNLISLLDTTFPDANRLFTSPPRTDGSEKWVDFVAAFWHCECVCGLSEKAFAAKYQKWCRKHGYHFSEDKALDIYASACGHFGVMPKTDTAKLLVEQAIFQLRATSAALAALKQEMQSLAASLPEYPVVMEMFGVGPTLGPQLMAEIGDVRRFHSKKALVAFAGIDAPPYQSGQMDVRSRSISKRGSAALRRTLFLVMGVYLQSAPMGEPVYQFMDKKRSEGKPYRVYMMASANKFLRIYYASVTAYLNTQTQA